MRSGIAFFGKLRALDSGMSGLDSGAKGVGLGARVCGLGCGRRGIAGLACFVLLHCFFLHVICGFGMSVKSSKACF